MQKEDGVETLNAAAVAAKAGMEQRSTAGKSVVDFKIDELRKIAAIMGLKFEPCRLERPE